MFGKRQNSPDFIQPGADFFKSQRHKILLTLLSQPWPCLILRGASDNNVQVSWDKGAPGGGYQHQFVMMRQVLML